MWDDFKDFFTGGNVNTTGMSDAQAKTARTSSVMQNTGLLMAMFGSINSAIGGYFQAQTAQYQARSQALSLGLEADMAAINARQAETSAQSTLEAGKSQIFNRTMQAGQHKASTTAGMAARGITLGSGTSKEISASQDIVKDIDVFTIDANATRQAAMQRTQATNYQNQSLLDRTAAANANRTADSISPFSALTSSLLTSASTVGQQWNNRWRTRMMFSSGYGAGGFN